MSSRAARLAELKALRASGKTRLSTYKVEEAEDIYDEHDETGYNKVVRARLDRDDFVIDDNGEGYADDGREEWMGAPRDDSASGSEPELPLKGKAAKRKREEDLERAEKTTNSINKYFSKGHTAAAPKPKPVNTVESAAFMADLLAEVDTNVTFRPPLKTVKTPARRKVRVLSPPTTQSRAVRVLSPPAAQSRTVSLSKNGENELASNLLDTPPLEPVYDDDMTFAGDLDDDDFPMYDEIPSSPITKAVERKAHSPTKAPPDIVDPSGWNKVTSKLNVLSSETPETRTYGKLQLEDAVEEDGSVRMFWMDYTEVNGSLCLFGKVKDRKTGSHVSALVKVDNILRKLYFLPRPYRRKHGQDTSEEVEMGDVYTEVDQLMTKIRVGMHKIKPTSRKYAFELPNIPKEADYLKLMYPYEKPALAVGLTGDTFSHVFGTTTALFEQFVLWKGIMGPCWLNIEGADLNILPNASWCKFEVAVSSPKAITTLPGSEAMETPPLTFMSVALRTVLNVKENKQEILVASARVYENVSINDTTQPERLPCQTFTVIRPVGSVFPTGFEKEAKKQRGSIMLAKNEQLLLAKFLALLEKTDPDVLIGHQLEGVDYPVLLSRLREKKISGWHRIGRLRRSNWPQATGKGGGSFFVERQLVSGRLLCDIANDMGKSLMTKCQSWNLTEMCSLYLGEEYPRDEIDNEVALKTWATSSKGLLNYVTHCEADTFLTTAIALKVQMLPLTKVLTNLAGNSWGRTLTGTRAERNEYILLHEFHKNKYICPDKIFDKGKPKVEEENPEGDEGADVKKKDKYQGGLVFEPEKGLYDKFILVMDFNSLYPSIIQEYNICFTTVDRTEQNEGSDNIPEVPTDQTQGILPKLIATLVSRRKQVKSNMKDKRATPDQLATWDIKQLALKLTANSMYGCLGYARSRFYARPLAMLTTFKGREILLSTKDLAESSQLRVIYGDTDSVMINTNADNIEEALKVGRDFKRSVNERYKLLEIDIDNVFRRLLLHAKKKYAAINMLEVDGKYVDKLEVKGLDMKRREYCALSKEASSRLLNEILSGDDLEVVVVKVHEYLRELSEKMREEKIPPHKYIIFNKLGKNPKDYPNAESMPQVQVALRALAQGKPVRVNDVISYIMTSAASSNTSASEAPAKRAYAPAEVTNSSSTLKPDIEWYLSKQIFPAIERLCAPIPGTNAVHLAECLGLDARKYSINSLSTSNQTQEISPLESQIPDSVRFKDATRLTLQCRFCKNAFVFDGLLHSVDNIKPDGIVCPAEHCRRVFSTITVVAQLEHAIRLQTSKYYSAWLVCDDELCGNRTRQMSVYGQRCLGPKGRATGCRGKMNYEMTEKALYNQLLYFRSLWDVDVGKKAAVGSGEGAGGEGAREKVRAVAEWNRERFGTCAGVVDGYLRKCGRVWVQMDELFRFALGK